MGVLSLRLPESLHARIKEFAKKDGISANQFITLGAAERCAALAALDKAGVARPPTSPASIAELARAPRAEPSDGRLAHRRLLSLAQYLRELRAIASSGRERYTAQWLLQRAAERSLQLAIDVCGDIAEHVVGERHMRRLGSSASAFDLLVEAGLIEPPLASSLARLAHLRNVLARDYVKVDVSGVFEAALVETDAMERFADVMRKLTR